MSVDGIRCPHNGQLLKPASGEFVHASQRMLEMNRVSFHLPQVIVPEYASGERFLEIWTDFDRWPITKFLREVWGIALDTGSCELSETDLKACCADWTFDQIQSEVLSGKRRYAYIFSGLDWGGSDYNPATKSKISYTVHTMWGLRPDGIMDLIYAYRHAGQNYQDIAGTIVAAHNKFKAFGMGTDNGGGAYYNAYMRDCGRIPTNRIITFNYSETKSVLERIPHPDAHLYALHRTDSLTATIFDIKNKRVTFPRWDTSHGFVSDCLNLRRNITESQSGRGVMRYMRPGSKSDDFLQSMNYALTLKRIVTKEAFIPNQQVLSELSQTLGLGSTTLHSAAALYAHLGGHFSG